MPEKLRDEFAKSALLGILQLKNGIDELNPTLDTLNAYVYADQMLKARDVDLAELAPNGNNPEPEEEEEESG